MTETAADVRGENPPPATHPTAATHPMAADADVTPPQPRSTIPARVVLLTHYIPLYQVRVFQEIAAGVSELHVLLSTPLEPNRRFDPDWADLDVRLQKNWTLRRRWRHRAAGFEDPLYVHLPYDTLSQLRRLRPDVVLSLELGARSLAAVIHRSLHRRSRLVLCTYMSEHTEQGRGAARHLLRSALLRAADAVTYNGPSCRDYLRRFGLPESRLFPLPYAADDRLPLPAAPGDAPSTSRRRLLCAGQLSQRKGVLPLVTQLADYCRQRPARQVDLTLAGDGPLADAVRRVPRPPNLHLQLTGHLQPQQLTALMAEHGAAVLPTLADEWLLVVDESLRGGLPVIGSRYAQAVTTLIRDGVNGWQYDPLDDASLARCLDRYFDCDDATMREMRAAAARSVQHRTPQWAARGALDAISATLAAGPRPSRRDRGVT